MAAPLAVSSRLFSGFSGMMDDFDYERRFGGIARLYGDAALKRFAGARVCVIGIGGVGSWVVEALARSGIGHLTLIDLDQVAESNVNRQIHALGDEFGKAKVAAMAERVRAINPRCEVEQIEDFVTLENMDALIGTRFDYVVDAIDSGRIKVGLIVHCRRRRIPLIVSGSAGGQIDPTQIRMDDLARTTQDPLLAKVRSQLRRLHQFPKDLKKKFGVECVYSTEPLRYPAVAACDGPSTAPAGLNCAGFGSAMPVTATFGTFAAGRVLAVLAQTARNDNA